MKDLMKTHPSIINRLLSIADDSAPLAEIKNPMLAAAIAFVGGGFALAIYLRSWRDFWIPFGILLLMLLGGVITGEMTSLAIPFIWAGYAWRRVVASNARLDGGRKFHGIIEAEIVCPPPILTRSNKTSASLKN